MHDPGAGRAKSPQAAELGAVGPKLNLIKGRSPRLLATQAIQPAGSAWTFPAKGAPIEEVDQVHATDDRRIAITNCLEAGLEPMANGASRRARHLGGLPYVVGAKPLDPLC